MNVREISKQELKSTLETIVKIFKEHDSKPVGSILAGFSPDQAVPVFYDNGFRFFSAFENGGEIGIIALKDSHICTLAIKKYAQGRGVGTELIKSALSTFPKNTIVTVNADEEAIPFYEQVGFVADNPEDPVVTKNGLSYAPMRIKIK